MISFSLVSASLVKTVCQLGWELWFPVVIKKKKKWGGGGGGGGGGGQEWGGRRGVRGGV